MKTLFTENSPLFRSFSVLGLALLSGCGGGSDSAPTQAPAPSIYGQQGPYQGPIGTNRCASRFPVPRGGGVDIRAVVDGAYGWTRLVRLEQYEESIAPNGSYSAGTIRTTIRYVPGGGRYRDGRPLADIQSKKICSDMRFVPTNYGQPIPQAQYPQQQYPQQPYVQAHAQVGVAANLSFLQVPLSIHRADGLIVQRLQLNIDGRSRNGGLRWHVEGTGQGLNFESFLSEMQSSGHQAMSAGRLPDGDFELFFSGVTTDASGRTIRKNVRAVYHPDATYDDGFDDANTFGMQDDGIFVVSEE